MKFIKQQKNKFLKILFLILILFSVFNFKLAFAACPEGSIPVNFDKNSDVYKSNCGGLNNCFNFCKKPNGEITFNLILPGMGDVPPSPEMVTIYGATCDNNNTCTGGTSVKSVSVQPGIVTEKTETPTGTIQQVKTTNVAAETAKSMFKGSLNVIESVLGGAIGFLMFVISYIISIIAGFIISLEAFLIEIVLQLNSQVIQNEFVQSGFLISLSITNLIFVGGIIVIAIATILRIESYGIKQTLWRLIVMAILVNFSLTISGAIINISDNFSNYFLDSINPEVGPNGQQTSSKYGAFATAISGAFTPQRFFLNNSTSSIGKNSLNISEKARQEDLAAMAGGSLAGIIKPIISVFFVIIFLINIIIVLGTLIIMLLTRYITISFLLILAPLAWTMWIFSSTRSYWSEWWQKFMHWTFFTPLVLFFLYLCLLTLRGTSGGSNSIGGINFAFDPQRNDALGSIQSFVGSFLGDVSKTILSMIMMIGCVTGGLIAANKLGIEGAKAGLNVAGGVNKAAGNWWKNKITNTAKRGLNRAAGYVGSTITEQPPTYTGWRRIFNPINKLTYKVGGVAAKIIPEDKKTQLSSIAEKHGPITREQERQRRRDLLSQYRMRLEKINNELEEAPKLIAEEQNKINKIQEELVLLEQQYVNLKRSNADRKQLDYIDQQIADRKAEIEKSQSYIQNLIREKETERENIQKALKELDPSLLTSTLRITKAAAENVLSFTSTSIEQGYGAFKKGPKAEKSIKKEDVQKAGLSSEDVSKIADLLNMKIKIEEGKSQSSQKKQSSQNKTQTQKA